MALKLLQPGTQPLGQFDGYDSAMTNLKGGEVVTLVSLPVANADKAASDVFDGYVNDGAVEKRIVVSSTLLTGTTLFMLADEGISGYGTLIGSVLGSTVGQNVSGTVLGPHTTAGSGKVTCWDKPGLYAVSLDACDTDPTTGLQPTNPTLKTGDPLYAKLAGGLLTPSTSGATSARVGTFVSFETSGSLVTSSLKQVQALNSPSGSPAVAKQFKYAVFYFQPGNV